jgi:hypothetical protein
MSIVITQGATRPILISDITDADNNPLDVTGWTVRAILRRKTVTGPVIAEWRTIPTGSQGTATAIGREVTLAITPEMSAGWDLTYGILHAEITEPSPGERVERILDEFVYLDPEAVTT